MKKRPNLILREPVKLYNTKPEPEIKKSLEDDPKPEEIKEEIKLEKREPLQIISEQINPEVSAPKEIETPKKIEVPSLKEKMSPRIGQIWDYFCRKALEDGKLKKSFSLTRTEVMKGAGIGSTNTYRDALRKFQDLDLIKIDLRPGVNSGSIFTFTEKGLKEIGK